MILLALLSLPALRSLLARPCALASSVTESVEVLLQVLRLRGSEEAREDSRWEMAGGRVGSWLRCRSAGSLAGSPSEGRPAVPTTGRIEKAFLSWLSGPLSAFIGTRFRKFACSWS